VAHRLLLLSLALAFTAITAYAGWKLLGTPGLAAAIVLTAPVIGIALAKPLLGLLEKSVELTKAIAYKDIEGRHFEYKGRTIDVREDLTGARWLRVDDVRKIVPDLPQPRTLQNTMPDGLGYLESPRILRISAAALDDYLKKSHAQPSLRFRVWLQREVIYPSRQSRHRFKGANIDETP
jgi:hypothetical protein